MKTSMILSRLAGDSSVSGFLLENDDELMAMIKEGKPYTQLLEHVQESF